MDRSLSSSPENNDFDAAIWDTREASQPTSVRSGLAFARVLLLLSKSKAHVREIDAGNRSIYTTRAAYHVIEEDVDVDGYAIAAAGKAAWDRDLNFAVLAPNRESTARDTIEALGQATYHQLKGQRAVIAVSEMQIEAAVHELEYPADVSSQKPDASMMALRAALSIGLFIAMYLLTDHYHFRPLLKAGAMLPFLLRLFSTQRPPVNANASLTINRIEAFFAANAIIGLLAAVSLTAAARFSLNDASIAVITAALADVSALAFPAFSLKIIRVAAPLPALLR